MRFQCQPGCLKCCEKKGFIYLSDSDAKIIAKFLDLSAATFELRYLYRTKYLRRLRTAQNSQCPFLNAQGCSIHPVKPAQCRLFPFWPELVENKKEWNDTAAWCPGMDKGLYVHIEEARERAQEMIEAYPRTYGR